MSAVAMFDYDNDPTRKTVYLRLTCGQRVVVTGKEAEARGWWMGRSGVRVGVVVVVVV